MHLQKKIQKKKYKETENEKSPGLTGTELL